MLDLIRNFDIDSEPVSFTECKTGHINSTYFVTTESGARYVVQKINDNVFKKPHEVMHNIVAVTEFLKKKIIQNGGDPDRETLTVVKANDGKPFYVDADGKTWRVYNFICNARTEDVADCPELFELVGEAFGNFQMMLSDYDASTLYEAIPNFHNTKHRFATFLASIEKNTSGRANNCTAEIEFLKAREEKCSAIVDKIATGELPLRVTHNDTKLNNIMLDNETGKPLAVVDLDTVMPGSVLYDFGDAIRSGASSAVEDETDLSKVFVKVEMFDAFAKGFIRGLDGKLSETEIKMLPVGAYVITLENGMRFLTDYIDGDTYFRTEYPQHNLDRARNQFKLCLDIESKWQELTAVVEKYMN